MGRASKPITEKTHRRVENPVTHEIEVTILDGVQKALERIHQTLDREMLPLSNDDCGRLVERVRTLLDGMVPNSN